MREPSPSVQPARTTSRLRSVAGASSPSSTPRLSLRNSSAHRRTIASPSSASQRFTVAPVLVGSSAPLTLGMRYCPSLAATPRARSELEHATMCAWFVTSYSGTNFLLTLSTSSVSTLFSKLYAFLDFPPARSRGPRRAALCARPRVERALGSSPAGRQVLRCAAQRAAPGCARPRCLYRRPASR